MNTHKSYRILSTLACLAMMLALAFGSVSASPTLQAETDFAAMDAYVTEQMNNLGIPGMALGIVQGDQIVHLQGFGVADSSGRAVTPQTPFYIGSVTKSFTALSVMQLVEAGKIDLDAPVQTYLPWFELADKEASAKITVRNLLNHTTGFLEKDGDRGLGLMSQQGSEEVVRGLVTLKLSQPVGTTFHYSNLNYTIAGLIVEKVSGQSYGDYVTKHIFEPLDMRHSYASRILALAEGLSEGHHYISHAFKWESDRPPSFLPSGGLIASVEDLTHYAIAQLNDGRYGSTSILSPQGTAELHTPAISTGGDRHYALGWAVSTWDGIPIVSHSGNNCCFHSFAILMPDRGSGVILLANADGLELTNLVETIAKGVFGMLYDKPAAPVSVLFGQRFLYWIILLTPFLQIIGIVFSWRYWRNKGMCHIFLTVMLYGGIAIFWLFGLPQMIGHTILGIRFGWPEIAYASIVGAALGIGWSVIYTGMNLSRRRAK
jgi:CubicO group peptidase (beta-lactamase class C family)